MELLAPAGSKEALVAAVEAGADAVYVGLQEFNARRKAKNFNLYDLQVMLDYIHTRGKKLYLALNILIKQREIPAVFDILNRLASLSIDAVIIHDLGLLHILKRYFPHIPYHASTQMTVHNAWGAKFLEKEGFSRVILARELSLLEILEIRRSSSIELEVFAHGALCFSIAGLCFASSYIGGNSGNRGLCTQPCRRIWKSGKKEGYLLSTRDLQCLDYISKLREAGVKCLKIEGRMRSAEYVSRVVANYRKAIDKELSHGDDLEDYSREKCSYFLMGRKGPIILSDHCGSTGKLAGVVKSVREGVLTIKADHEIRKGNRLRVCNYAEDITYTFSVKEIFINGESVKVALPGTYCEIPCANPVKKGSFVYIVRSAEWNEGILKKKVNEIYSGHTAIAIRYIYSRNMRDSIVNELLKRRKGKEKTDRQPSVRIDTLKWLDIIRLDEISDIIVSIDSINGGDAMIKRLSAIPSGKVIIDIPPFLSQNSLIKYKEKIVRLCRQGYRRWMAENVAHLVMFSSKQVELISGPFLYAMNSLSSQVLSCYGVKEAVSSYEDEFLNIRDTLNSKDLGRRIILFAYPPCFITRIDTGLSDNSLLIGSDREFLVRRFGEITYIVSKKPYSVFQYREKLAKLSPSGFVIDLCFCEPSRKLWDVIRNSYRNGKAFPGSIKYNFKQGLK